MQSLRLSLCPSVPYSLLTPNCKVVKSSRVCRNIPLAYILDVTNRGQQSMFTVTFSVEYAVNYRYFTCTRNVDMPTTQILKAHVMIFDEYLGKEGEDA